jgi:hypothetical protein
MYLEIKNDVLPGDLMTANAINILTFPSSFPQFLIDAWFSEMKVGILFEGVGYLQEHPLIKVLPHDL